MVTHDARLWFLYHSLKFSVATAAEEELREPQFSNALK